MGRKRHYDPPVEFRAKIPQSLHERVQEELADPVTGKPSYGSQSKLLQRLLREWLNGER